MPDPAEQDETQTPVETPTTESVPSPAEPIEADQTSTETPPEPKTYTSWQDALKDADVEELLKHDAIAGRIGQVADKRARELAAQQKQRDEVQRQAEADRAEDRRMRDLRSQNPVAYATEMDRKDATTDAIREEASRQARMAGDITGELETYVKANYSKDVYESLANKSYPGTLAQGVTQYIHELNTAERTNLRAKWEADERPALRKQILSELNGGEPSIDSSSGGARAGKKFNSNLEASTALYEGRITVQEYTRQVYINGWR